MVIVFLVLFHYFFMSRLLILYFFLLSFVLGKEVSKEVHFYCRSCGAIIANISNLIPKEADGNHVVSRLEHQEGNLHIPYQNFNSSVFFCCFKANRCRKSGKDKI